MAKSDDTIVKQVVDELASGSHPIPITGAKDEGSQMHPVPVKVKEITAPVATFPGRAPEGSPPPSPQPVYPVADPNSWLGMRPAVAKLVQLGFAGLVAFAFWWLLEDKIKGNTKAQESSDTSNAKTQAALIDAFQTNQKDLIHGVLETQVNLQVEMRTLSESIKLQTKVMEKMSAGIDAALKKNPQ